MTSLILIQNPALKTEPLHRFNSKEKHLWGNPILLLKRIHFHNSRHNSIINAITI